MYMDNGEPGMNSLDHYSGHSTPASGPNIAIVLW